MDAQIGHEKTITGLIPVMAGNDFIYGLGMVDMGMAVSYEQFVMDAEFVRMFKRIEQGMEVNDDTLALDVIQAVGPAGNFLGQRHTLNHMRKELSTTTLIDRRMRDSWEKHGSLDMPARARAKAKEILNTHVVEPLPPEIARRIREIIEEELENHSNK